MNNTEVKKYILDWIETNKTDIEACSQFMFDNPELGIQEYRASRMLTDLARQHGFTIQLGVAGMPTAFVGSWGSGKPVIGFNVEYDCLPGLSQKVSEKKEPVIEGAPGQGCGHCLLGPAAIQGALALRRAMEKFGLKGTVKIFGTPAEETSVGKPFMAREGLLDGVDAFLDWHPYFNRSFVHRYSNCYFSKYYHFFGKSTHGNAPWNGQSALDAATLMSVAVEMLREHIPPPTESGVNTINYTYANVGPEFPSVVPDRSTAWYIGRCTNNKVMLDIIERIDNCARGAALATGTAVEMQLVTGTHEYVPNATLGDVIYGNLEALGPMQLTEAEQDFAKAMQKNAGFDPVGIVQKVVPMTEGPVTDVSEFTWLVPLATVWLGVLPGPELHNWVITSAAGSSIGKKAVHYAAKLLAASGADILLDPAIVDKAKAEHKERMGDRVFKTILPESLQVDLNTNKATMAKYFDPGAK
ncbi:glutamate carboxypeptidase [Deltaproteobacteria bacterium]|nr:glutamate carboxypeptidase [Deltaproteobacteria bacterium]